MYLKYLTIFPILLYLTYDSISSDVHSQTKYIIDTQRAVVEYYNRSYLTQCKVYPVKYNRTTSALNISLSFQSDVPAVDVEADVFIKTGLTYRPTVIQRRIDFCNALKHDYYGLGAFKQTGNFTNCPLKHGTISVWNFRLESSKFPPFIPAGEYKISVYFYVDNFKVIDASIYGAIIYK